MQSNIDLVTPIKCFPLILDGHNAGALWLLCRGMDKIGSGKISFTMQEMMSILEVSKVTLSRYMNSDLFYTKQEILDRSNGDVSNYNFVLDKHIYHYNKLGEVVYTLYYKSICDVVDILCLKCDGKIRYKFIDPTELRKSYKRILSTEILVSIGQKAAYSVIRTHQTKNRDVAGVPQKITISSDLFPRLSESDKFKFPTNLGIKKISDGVLLINSDVSKVAVVSHNTIAKQMGRHRTTIGRRLKKSTVEKKRILLTSRLIKSEGSAYFKMYPSHTYYMTPDSKILINVNGVPCQKYCSIYDLDYKTSRHMLIPNVSHCKKKKLLANNIVKTNLIKSII